MVFLRVFLLLFPAAGLLFSGCDLFNFSIKYKEMDEGWFWAYDGRVGDYYETTGERLFEGEHCIIYAEDPGAITDIKNDKDKNIPLREAAAAIGGVFDAGIYDKIRAAFGEPIDVDGNGKVILLFLDILDGYTDSGAYTSGYFNSNDMGKNPYSNYKDMLYIDTNPGIPGSALSNNTMAHELQHLINYSQRTGKGKTRMDTWIDEGLSTAAEYMYDAGTITNEHISFLRASRNDAPVYKSFLYGNNFFVWNGRWEEGTEINGETIEPDPLTNYATAFIFFQWLRIHASNGAEIFKDIINSDKGDYRAVTEAAARRIGLEYGSWETLLQTWFAANLLGNAAGHDGYRGELNPPSWYFHSQEQAEQVDLAPGEGVYSVSADGSSPSAAGSIGYGVLTRDNAAGTPGDPVNILLTFNKNPDNRGGVEIGFLANQAPGEAGASGGASLIGAAPGTPFLSLTPAGSAGSGQSRPRAIPDLPRRKR